MILRYIFVNQYQENSVLLFNCYLPTKRIDRMKIPDCIICTEKVTPSKKTNCPYCNYEACVDCVRRYVLNETEPKCMNCKKTWTRAHQNALLKPSFVNNQLRHQQEQVFYEREMALFPATIEVIDERRTTNKLVSECRMNEMKIMAIHYNILYCNSVIKENNRICGLLQTSPKMYSDYNADELNKQTQQMDEKHRAATAEYEKASHHNMVTRNLLRMT